MSPSLPMAILAALTPAIAVGQFRWLAAAAALAAAATVVAHRRRHGAWPWPRGPVLATTLALFAWAGISAIWAAEPGRAFAMAVSLAGFVALGAGAATAVAADGAAARARLLAALGWGLGAGVALAAADHLTGNGLRAALRGLPAATPTLFFGLKPAVSVIAVLLPVALVAAPIPRGLRLALGGGAVATALLLPADAAKLAVLAGLAAAGVVALFTRGAAGGARTETGVAPVVRMEPGAAPAARLPPGAAPAARLPPSAAPAARAVRLLGFALAAAILAAPLLAGAALPRLGSLAGWPPSAAHRLLVWDFTLERIAERPWRGWGAEASRTIPAGRERVTDATLARFGLEDPASRAWFTRAQAQAMPLHPHNMALQLWLELGAVGAVLGAAVVAALGFAAARAPPAAAAGALTAAALVGALSYGVWQEWWIGVLILLAAALAAAGQRARGP